MASVLRFSARSWSHSPRSVLRTVEPYELAIAHGTVVIAASVPIH